MAAEKRVKCVHEYISGGRRHGDDLRVTRVLIDHDQPVGAIMLEEIHTSRVPGPLRWP